PLLEQLTDEVTEGCRDRTLPASATVHQIWVQAHGRIQLLEPSLEEIAEAENGSEDSTQSAGLSLLRQVAVLILERTPRTTQDPPLPLRAPLPTQAGAMLNRLLAVDGRSFATVEQFRVELALTRDQPTEVTSDQRAA